jgi:hypothetical protein
MNAVLDAQFLSLLNEKVAKGVVSDLHYFRVRGWVCSSYKPRQRSFWHMIFKIAKTWNNY